jgi:hypothetical protein
VKRSRILGFVALHLLASFATAGTRDAVAGARTQRQASTSASKRFSDQTPGALSHVARRLTPRLNSQIGKKRVATIRNKTRFLGWNYAAAHPEASRWSSDSPQRHPVPNVNPRSRMYRARSRPHSANPASSNVGFGFLPGLPTGFIPTAVVTGDFNEDGHMDAAISNGGDNTIYVLLGNGDNTFQAPELLYTQGLAPVWITAVSLRNNGHLDLAVVDADSKSLEIFFGKGNGTFSHGGQFSLPQIPTFVLAGDFNKDGKQDLAVGLIVDAASIEPQFEVLLGEGNGEFSGTLVPPPIEAITGAIPTGWIAEADLNKDGFPDLVTTITGGAAITYLNQSGGAFTKSAAFGPTYAPMVVELADVNEDGCPDAVELDYYGYLTIAAGTCDGNFTQAPAVADVGDLDPAVKVVDVDGDGHLDLVGSSAFYDVAGPGLGNEGGYLVSVLKGDGKGNFSPAATYRGGTDEFSLAVADFNGDNRPEILTIDSFENQASLFTNDGTGNFDGPRGETIGYLTGLTNGPITGAPILSADINGDGKPDLLVAELGEGSQPSQLTVMLNDGTGKFLAPLRTPITVGPYNPYPEYLTAGFRNPAKPDVVYFSKYGSNVIAFFPSNGDGTFGTPTALATLPNTLKVTAGDFNRDGNLDFVVLGYDSSGKNLEFDVFLGHGNGTFTQLPSQLFAIQNAGMPYQFFAVDLNHDGKLDLLIGNNLNGGLTTSDDLIEVLGNGDGTFQKPATLIAHFGAVALADVNHDGYVDLIQGRDPSVDITKGFYFAPGVTVYLGLPNGTFQQQPSYDLPGFAVPTLEPVLVGDFNGDGIPDIAFRYFKDVFHGTTEPTLRLLQGNGDGTFIVADHTYQLQGVSNPSIGMDFNGDGKTDLVELIGYTSSFHTIAASPAASLDIALDSNPVIGNNGSAAVSLDLPAPNAEDVTLSASDPAIQMPPTLHFNAGQQVQHFAFTLGTGFDTSHVFALYAKLVTETAVAYGSKPNPNVTVGVAAELLNGAFASVTEMDIRPGEHFPLILQLLSESGYTGTFSHFQCIGLPAGASCQFDANSAQVLPGDRAQVGFQVSTSSSTPYGTYAVQVSSTDGFVLAQTIMKLGIGDFSLSVSPSTVPVGPNGSVFPVVTSTSTNGLNEEITLACNGLPSGATCQQQDPFGANGGSSPLIISYGGLSPRDYPFQIIGSISNDNHQTDAVLSVGDFSASIDKTSATLSAGGSDTFHVLLTSINHYATNITVSCQLPNSLSCTVSPTKVALADDGKATVTLTVKASSMAATIRPDRLVSWSRGSYAFVSFLPLSLILIRRRRRMLFAFIIVALMMPALVSCGGGSSGGSTGNHGSGGPTPVQVNMTVAAQADTRENDSNNQKTLGPIVITVQ